MRRARRKKDGQWYMIDERDGICHLQTIDWERDKNGFWPRVDCTIADFREQVHCPGCNKVIELQEMDCVFGITKRDRGDIINLARCLDCRLPVRIRVKGLINGYPSTAQRMVGWSSWEKRKREFAAEEIQLFGAECLPP
jgi:hypothetical protein